MQNRPNIQLKVIAGILVIAGVFQITRHLIPTETFPTEGSPSYVDNRLLASIDDDDTLLIPSDQVLNTMTNDQLINLWWSYIHTIQVICRNQVRVGSLNDGGKEVCIDKEYKPMPNKCLVYSIGSKLWFDFEEAASSLFNCEIHTFDPSVGYTEADKKKIPKTVHYHTIGLDDFNGQKKDKKWEMMTLSNMLSTFGHSKTTLDILKIDIEFGEWTAIPEMIRSGAHKQVKQLQLEVHFRLNMRESTIKALKVLRLMYENGFRIFMRERNIVGCLHPYNGKKITTCNELSFINICYRQKC